MLRFLWPAMLAAGALISIEVEHVEIARLRAFKGEHACLDPEFGGEFSVLRADLLICNNEAHDAVHIAKDALFSIAFDGVGTTSFRLPYLRDNYCPDGARAKFYRFNHFALSAGCCCRIPREIGCTWLLLDDMVMLPAPPLSLHFAYANSTTDFATSELQDVDATHRRHFNPLGLVIFPLSTLFIFLLPYTLELTRARRTAEPSKKLQ